MSDVMTTQTTDVLAATEEEEEILSISQEEYDRLNAAHLSSPIDTKPRRFGHVPEARIGRASVLFAHSYCLINAPFNKDFMSQLKQQIPRNAREWLPDAKKWRVYRPYVNEAVMILALHFAQGGEL